MNEQVQIKPWRSFKLLLLLLVGFAVLTGARLNQFYLYNPDSAGYVLMARGLIDHHEYRQYDQPGEPYFTLRPPGMSVLLIPAALIAPYDLIAAKVTVILTALMMVWLFYMLVWRLFESSEKIAPDKSVAFRWGVFLIGLLLVTNPYILLYSTIVMSEIPFTACSLAVLYLLASENEKLSKRKLVLLSALLIFLPFLRTIGIAMVLAVGLWAVVNRKRWTWLIPVGLSICTTAVWMLRNRQYKSISYSSVALEEIRTEGIVGTLISMLNRSLIHFEGLCQKLFPGMPGASPEYDGLLSDNVQYLPGNSLLYELASLVVYLLAFAGMLRFWKKGGAIAFLYLCLSFGVLSLWPWMQTRFTLPLLPVILAFVPAGFLYFRESLLADRVLLRKSLAAVGLIAAVGLLVMQSRVDADLVATNSLMVTGSQEELAREDLIIFASDFVKAGEWLNQHTATDVRVLTRRSEVSTASHRFQRQIYFHPSKIDELHAAIQSLGGKYLVSYGKYNSDLFPRRLLDDDLIYRMTPVFEDAGVVVIEVKPNYEGTVREKYWREEEAMELAKEAVARHPERITVCMTYINQLMKADEHDAIIEFIDGLEEREIHDARFVCMRGWAYVGKRQYERALKEFARATRMPGQKLIRKTLADGITLSQKRLKAEKEGEGASQLETPSRYLKLAKKNWKLVYFHGAESYARKVLDANEATQAEHDEAHVLLARLYLTRGKTEQALKELDQVQSADQKEAKNLKERIELEELIGIDMIRREQSQDPQLKQLDSQRRKQILKLATLYEEQGVPGKALKILEQAHNVDPDDMSVLRRLAKLQLFYHLLPQAKASYQSLKKTAPDDEEIQAALARIQQFQQSPRF